MWICIRVNQYTDETRNSQHSLDIVAILIGFFLIDDEHVKPNSPNESQILLLVLYADEGGCIDEFSISNWKLELLSLVLCMCFDANLFE